MFLSFFVISANINETMTDEAIQTHYGRDTVMATVKRMSDGKIIEYKLSDFPVAEKLEKFMEDVKYGIYPLTAFALSQPPPPKTRAVTPSEGPIESAQSVTPEPFEPEDRWGIDEWGTDGRTSFHVLVWKDLFDPYSEISHYEIRHTPEENADSLFDDKANVHSILDNVPAGVERLNLTEIGFEDVSGTFFIRAVNKRMCSGPWNRCGLKDEQILWGDYSLQQSIGFYTENRAPYSDVDISWAVTGLSGYKVDRFKVTLYPQQYIPSDPSQLPETGRVNAVVLYEGTEPKCSVRFSHLANEDLHFGVITVTPYFYEEELIASSILTIPWQLELDTDPPEAPKSLRIL